MRITRGATLFLLFVATACSSGNARDTAKPQATLVTGGAATSAGPPPTASPSSSASLQGLTVKKSAVVQTSLGSAAYVTFTNDGDQAGGVEVQFTAYDTGGNVVGTGRQSVAVVRADEDFALGASIDVPNGQKATRITTDLHFANTATVDPHPTSVYLTRGVRYNASDLGGKVQGEVVSHYQQTLTNVYAQAVCFGTDGGIDGGGFTFIGRIIGGSTAGASVNVFTIGTPTHCELYATNSNLSSATGG